MVIRASSAARRRALLLCGLLAAAFAPLVWGNVVPPEGEVPVSAAVAAPPPHTVVIDAGHGGEDGGAVSPGGVAESGVNLDISLRLRDLLRLMGRRTVLTREADVSLGDPALKTIRERKVSDIRRRVELVNNTDNAVLISVHQNSLPSSPVTHGAQAFWNPDGQLLGEAVQSALNETVNRGNEKQSKQIASTIYLTRHALAPAVLVECGFLSNEAETALLQTPDHQKTLAAAIAAGYLRCEAAERGAGP